MIEIFIVDDHAIVREGLAKLIDFEKDIKVVGMASDSAQALKMITNQKMDVIILDISMPGRSGLDIIKDIKTARPGVYIIILSMYQEERFAIRAFKSGASGYITKDMATEEIVNAIRKVQSGGKYISARFAETLVNEMSSPSELLPHERLSDREFEVMCMLASGKTVSTIAKELFLSDHTISTYRRRILDKMNLKNNADLIHYAVDHGFWV
ncbi:MAG TPA: response regulator transcription factor [Bacteroidales bacterium]|nr:response regulator transcription factor [Bacteroidales bacterium]HPS61455.1 response regulator transcription factor [Bacteroidales bacterium]